MCQKTELLSQKNYLNFGMQIYIKLLTDQFFERDLLKDTIFGNSENMLKFLFASLIFKIFFRLFCSFLRKKSIQS